ncbi:MAG: hypothetical protein RLO12_02760 [Fulvivirga sp.]
MNKKILTANLYRLSSMALFYVFAVAYQPVNAQIDSVQLKFQRPTQAVRLSPMFLFNRFPTIQLGYEARLSSTFNVLVGAGVIMSVFEEDYNSDYINRRGGKFNVELRHYFSPRDNGIWFISLGTDYFHVNFDRGRTFGFDCSDIFGNCSYYQYRQYTVQRRDYRLGLRGGILTYMGKKDYLDIGIGAVISFQTFRTLDKLSGFDIQYGRTNLKEEGNRTLLLPVPVVNIGYKFR